MTPEAHNRECLSFGDALFLHLERDGMPLHVASLCVFEGALTTRKLTHQIQARSQEVPRFRQKVVPPAWALGVPVWEYDSDFRIESHIGEVSLKRGDERELQRVTEKILSTRLERNKPLWDMTLFTGLKNSRSAVLLRVHHAVADGISGVELMKVIMDRTPSAPPNIQRKPNRRPAPTDSASKMVESVATSVFYNIDRVLKAESELLTFAQQMVANGSRHGDDNYGESGSRKSLLDELANMIPGSLSATEPMPFNVICRGPQKFAWTAFPFDELRSIKRHFGVTVNDVVLAMVSSTVERYARLHHVRTTKKFLRIAIPVSSRTRAQNGDLGNRISFVPVTVPLGIKSPAKLLADIHQRMQVLKTTKLAELVAFTGTMLGTIPTPIQALLGPLVSQLPLNLCNLICTNVPGPQEPLYLAGHKLLACYPYVPIGGTMGMNCAVLTYDGKAFFGFTGDSKGIPDLEILPKFLNLSFAELRRLVPARPKSTARKKPVAREELSNGENGSKIKPNAEVPEKAAMAVGA